MLKKKVKASHITNLTDARYFAAWEVEWLGFNFDEGSEYYISPIAMKSIKEWVEGVKFVGELSFSSAEQINATIADLDLDIIQVGMFAEFSILEKIKNATIIKEMVISGEMNEADVEAHLKKYAPVAEYFLWSFEKNDTTWEMVKNGGVPISISFFEKMCAKYKIILNINLSKEVMDEILNFPNLHGLNVKGGEEEKVGVKSFDELDEIFEALEILI